jgi:hypothetical protein
MAVAVNNIFYDYIMYAYSLIEELKDFLRQLNSDYE